MSCPSSCERNLTAQCQALQNTEEQQLPASEVDPYKIRHINVAASEEKLYSYAIMRRDIHMPEGKLAAQAGHVFAQSLIEFLSDHPEWIPRFKDLGKSGSRIALKAKNLSQILKVYERAKEAGLPCCLFSDEGHILPPDFNGDPVITGVGIGPAPKDLMRPITKKFNCL